MQGYTINTRAYKTVHNQPIYVDVYTVDPPSPSPVLLWFHGGYIITGDRTAIPPWLVNAAFKRRWTIVSADYRCLPESTGLELIEDLRDAYSYVAQNLNVEVPSLINPKPCKYGSDSSPAAILALYPMSSPCSERWTSKGLRWDEGLSASETAETAADIERRLTAQEVSFGEAFPKNDDIKTHKRWNTLRYILEQARFVDYLTGVRGLGARIADGGPEAIPAHLRVLFPTNFAITSEFPPLILVHGTMDRDVPVADGEAWVNKCREVGARVTYYPVEGMDHAFDITYDTVEEEDQSDDPGKTALFKSLKDLDMLIR
ncbi:hypothetical protein N7462_007244 [Penicillium macrosclerotiorum]|uniref:uncharacterized protein n=1 Tax=Penicillium macrosclerotiorum TaxID=303699 RepID=UPI00254889EF|nr:uncharacterized protein N7462_007244 [Penicillium macrosclerotiorum]KAJ5679000.1 hypothetical protein N7462_007244 [Penicillium macrosclerotiorum]